MDYGRETGTLKEIVREGLTACIELVVLKEVNLIQFMTYFTLGKWIVEVQQNGERRAQYGKKVLITLSETLNKEFGKGFSVATLTNIRKFYLTYQDQISEPVVTEFAIEKSQPLVTKLKIKYYKIACP